MKQKIFLLLSVCMTATCFFYAQQFTVATFNLHCDHQGIKARQESSKLILQKMHDTAGAAPVIFTGDFNGGHEPKWYKTVANSGFMKDAYGEALHPYANGGSFNGFGATAGRNEIIDHIFISSAFKVQRYGILTDTYRGKYPFISRCWLMWCCIKMFRLDPVA